MSTIQKLYEIAGVPKCRNKFRALNICPNSNNHNCKNCYLNEYPPFDSEVQLKLLNFMTTNFGGFELNYKDGKFHIDTIICGSEEKDNLTDAIASLTLICYQFLGEEFKKEVRDILC